MFHLRVLGVLLVLSILANLGACSASSPDDDKCVDRFGFPISCSDPGAIPVKSLAPPVSALWADSAMGVEVLTASGETVSFTADTSHVLVANGRPLSRLRATREGSVLEEGLHVGYVVYVLLEDGAIGTALVAPDGTLFEVGEGLHPTDRRPDLVPLGAVGVLTEEAVATGLPVAAML